MPYEKLKARVHRANMDIHENRLAVLTWGNASEVDRATGVVAIKPSGVPYDELAPEHICVISLHDGMPVDGDYKPSSDTPTHLHLYRAFEAIGGIVHTHSPYATAWAQAKQAIPCYGTTHADHFYGPIPCARELTRAEIEREYELNTGRVIERHFQENGLDPVQVPGVLVASHGPFAWAADAAHAVEGAVTLEETAKIALLSRQIHPGIGPVPAYLLDKHFLRKHGAGAYYGQT